MMKSYKVLFFNSLIMGTMMSISANSWFSAWMGLEINLISIIPLMKSPMNKYPSESTLKYFIVQVMASSILLFSIITVFMLDNLFNEFKIMESILISTALLLKMGAAPFHFWLPEVINGLNWNNSFILLTWQKIAPIVLLTYQIKIQLLFISMIIILSSMIGGIQGLNQICLRKIMTYSSMNHLSWMIASLLNSLNICIMYFLFYCLINMNLILIFNKFHIFYLNQLVKMLTYKKNMKFLFMLNFLSLGGLPPFLGFFPKWISMQNMVEANHYTLSSILIILSMISLYFYLRITFSSFTFLSEEIIILNYKMNFTYFMINFLSLMSLMMYLFTDSLF